ncbi:hypothetical protein M3Y97_00846300 [Aphelenchoides bicaudatus]|nr:hypothetical protein M3Y97_00846300 [Aphelenchoides bicaudatus]
MAFVDQYKLRTIVEIEENDSFTTNSSSSCFTSPSIDSSPPAIRRLQTLSLAPRPAYDLWNSGIYSPPDTNANESTTLNRKLTLNSDSGRESDSSFCSENELSPPIKRYTTHALTIYQLEKAKQQSSTFPRLNEKKARNSHTVSTKIFINEDEIPKPGQKQPLFEQRAEETDPSSTVLKIYIPPAVEKNVADRIAKHNEALAKAKTPFHMNVQPPHSKTQEHIVTPKYGVDSSGYRVVAWENEASRTPGRIADFKPEVDRVDRWHNEKSGAEEKRGSQSSIASSPLLTSVIVGAEDRKQNNTAVQLNQTPIKSFSTNHSIEPLRYKIATDRTERTIGQLKNRVEDDPLITVNGKQRCVNCSLPLSRGQAMTIDSLGLFFHLHCFRCSDCGTLLSSGNARGMDVRVAGTKIQCNQCYNFANANVHYSQI